MLEDDDGMREVGCRAGVIEVLEQCLGRKARMQMLPAQPGDVEATDAAAQRAWFGGRPRFTAFQWHYDVFDLPNGATRVLTNDFNPNQGYLIDDVHVGFQCHIEMTRDLVETWCHTGADDIAAPGTPARQSRDQILRDLEERLAALQAVADGVYTR